jgi:hypothetical protein
MGKKLCDWDKKMVEKKFDRLREMVSEPAFVCRKCARAARRADDLCKPLPLNPGPAAGEGSSGGRDDPA